MDRPPHETRSKVDCTLDECGYCLIGEELCRYPKKARVAQAVITPIEWLQSCVECLLSLALPPLTFP
jgi:hypothetical protein